MKVLFLSQIVPYLPMAAYCSVVTTSSENSAASPAFTCWRLSIPTFWGLTSAR